MALIVILVTKCSLRIFIKKLAAPYSDNRFQQFLYSNIGTVYRFEIPLILIIENNFEQFGFHSWLLLRKLGIL